MKLLALGNLLVAALHAEKALRTTSWDHAAIAVGMAMTGLALLRLAMVRT